jgi:uncharacterized oligopeptide transporter (OPT) family protein
MAGVALLTGLFLVPLGLLGLGHRLRERSAVQRAAFWGGVIGHSIALCVAVTALHVPPVMWQSGARSAAAFWSLLLGGAIGALLGVLYVMARRGRHDSGHGAQIPTRDSRRVTPDA